MSNEASNTLELSSIPRTGSANRFQVNLVDKNTNGSSTEAPEDEDQFNEDDAEFVKQRRTSRIQSLKSSFRDSKKERKESLARFKVSDENSDDEDENLLDGNEYDTKYGRSLRFLRMTLIQSQTNLEDSLVSDVSHWKLCHTWTTTGTSFRYKQVLDQLLKNSTTPQL